VKKTVLKYGLIGGIILGAWTGIVVPLCLKNGGMGSFAFSHVVGYSAMVLAFVAIFMGVRSYRENVGGGSITFGRAFKIGILIAFIASASYVAGWEIAYWGFLPDFGDKYAAMTLEKMRAKGEPAEKIAAMEKQMEQFKEWYKNPLLNVLITFVEVFPVGFLVTLVSAAILRKKPDDGLPVAAAA
jgi:hypothetical protein